MADTKSKASKYDLDEGQKMTLAERIAERHRRGESSVKRGAARAQLLALQQDIEQAYNAGWGFKAIHETLVAEARCSIGYSTFRTFCKEELGLERPRKTKKAAPPTRGKKRRND